MFNLNFMLTGRGHRRSPENEELNKEKGEF
jgi:hypothetical protein